MIPCQNGFIWDEGDYRIVVNFPSNLFTVAKFPDNNYGMAEYLTQVQLHGWEWAT